MHPVVFTRQTAARQPDYVRTLDHENDNVDMCGEWWSSTPIHGTPDMVTLIRGVSIAKYVPSHWISGSSGPKTYGPSSCPIM